MGGVGLGEGVIGEKWREMKETLMWVRQGGEAYVGEAGRRGLIMWVR